MHTMTFRVIFFDGLALIHHTQVGFIFENFAARGYKSRNETFPTGEMGMESNILSHKTSSLESQGLPLGKFHGSLPSERHAVMIMGITTTSADCRKLS